MKLFFVALSLIVLTTNAESLAHNVSSADDLETLLESGTVAPGDTIVWADGNYKDAEVNLSGVDGTEAAPITLKSATPGGVVLGGESQFKVGGNWWVVEGFHFDGGENDINNYNTFQFRGNNSVPAMHCRLTNCAFTNLKTEDETSKWIQIYGQDNSIDHCHFSGKDSKGALITVELAYLADDATAGHQITANYFADFAPQEGTDNETIRVGSSEDQNKRANCTISGNLFVRCNGEVEIITNKSSYNVYQGNTFRQCDGSLVLRHGHHATINGNFFFGDGATNAGGIRVVDSHHIITNNYLQDLTGTTWNSAFSILGGKQASGGSDNGYQAVDEITVAYNSIINCKRSIFLNKAKGSRAPTGLIANNLISSSYGPLVTEDLSAVKLQWVGNLLHGADVGPDVAALTDDPKLSEKDGLLRPDVAGPVAGAAIPIAISVKTDIDGQLRPSEGADIGADQVSKTLGDIVSKPLTPADVGVSFLRGEGITK
ncbi:polysaccharide lyase 6 family protein [bacterium]|nr:polysaccharide lyase 6 family protein [bacterium]